MVYPQSRIQGVDDFACSYIRLDAVENMTGDPKGVFFSVESRFVVRMFYRICMLPSYKFMEPLTEAQEQLYNWLAEYIRNYQHSPSIRQMMQAMKLKSPAPIQSRLEHLRAKG